MLRIAKIALSAILAGPLLLAQFGSGIQGTVLDKTNAIIPSARIRVTNTATGISREVTANEAGTFRVPSLSPGTYDVVIEAQGFTSAEQKGVTIGIDELRKVDFVLDVGNIVEKVTITGEGAVLETEKSRISGTLSTSEIRNLPAPGRNIYNLLALQPGVTGRAFGSDVYAGEV
ncbi:MAG TPA: hypothetical protein DEH78_00705, partial [Solibacterales bacterium]|nr:hypothetical protein [Bryobacterales bacterium]